MTEGCRSKSRARGLCARCHQALQREIDRHNRVARARGVLAAPGPAPTVPAPRSDDSTAWVDLDRLEQLTEPTDGMVSLTWKAEARCAGTKIDMFSPHTGVINQAKAEVCVGCPVVYECLAYALASSSSSDFGVWGNTNVRQRRRLRRTLARRRRARDGAEAVA